LGFLALDHGNAIRSPLLNSCNMKTTHLFTKLAAFKPNLARITSRIFLFALSLACLVSPRAAKATVFYWDPGGLTALTGTSNYAIWSITVPQWTSNNSALSSTLWTWGTVNQLTNAVCFCAGSYSGTNVTVLTNNVEFAGIFNGPLNPPGCTEILTSNTDGTGAWVMPSTACALDTGGSDGDPTILNVPIIGVGPLEPEGGDQCYLNASNSYTGGTILGQTGIVNFNNNYAFGTGAITMSATGGALVIEGSAPLTISNAVTAAAVNLNIVGNPAGLTFSGPWSLGATSPNVGVGGTGNLVIMAGPISGTGKFGIYNPSTMALNATNTHSGGTVLGFSGTALSGTVQFNNSNSFGIGPILLSNVNNATLAAETPAPGNSAIVITNNFTNLVTASQQNLNLVGSATGVTFSGIWNIGSSTLGLGAGGTGNLVIMAGPLVGSGTLLKYNGSTLQLAGTNTYTGATIVSNNGVAVSTLALGPNGSISNSPLLKILPGATFDVSAIPAFNLWSNTTLFASGTNSTTGAATINGAGGGSVSLGTNTVNLNFAPVAFTGDPTSPALMISNTALTFNNNTINITNVTATPLGAGTYTLIQVGDGTTGTINGAPNLAVPVVYGTGLAAGSSASLSIVGSTVNLVVASAASSTTTTLSPTTPITYGQSATFTATVSPVPDGGSVQFFLNGAPLGSPAAVNTTTGVATSPATSPSQSVGTYTITATFGGSPDNSFGSSSATSVSQVINTTPLTVTAKTQTTTYGTAIALTGSTQFTPTGLQNGETIGSVTLAVTATPPYSTNTPPGSYTITPSAATGGTFKASNYGITYVAATSGLTVSTKALTVTASSVSHAYGSTTAGPFTGQTGFTTSGLVNGQANANINVTLAYTGITANSPVSGSPYTGVIVPSAAVAASGVTNFNPANYAITYADGTLTITSLAVRLTGSQPYNGLPWAIANYLTVSNAVAGDTVDVVLGLGALASANPGVQTIASPATLVLGNAGDGGSGTGTGATAQFNAPTGIAVDTNDNVFVVDTANNRIDEITLAGVQTVLPFTGLTNPAAIAVDGADNLFVTDPILNQVIELPFGGAQITLAITGLNYPTGIAVDQNDDVFVADTMNSRIVEFTAGGVQSILPFSGTTGLYLPGAVAVDTNGDVYVANAGSNNIVELSATGVQSIVPFTGLNFGIGVAVDLSSNIYVVNYGGANVRALKNGVLSTPTFTNLSFPSGIAVDPNGNLFVSDTGHDRIAWVTNGNSLTLAGTIGTPNYTLSGSGGTVTNTTTPLFSGLSSHTTNYGSTITLSGTVSGPGPTYPASGTVVTVTVNGNAQATAISGSAGAFTINYNAAGIPASPTPYTVTYSSAAAGAFNAATDTSTTLTLNTLPVTITSGLTVNPVTYGAETGSLTSNSVVLSGVLAADLSNVQLNTNGYTATFTDTNANSSVAVTISGLTLSGSAAANYTLAQPALTGTINPATLTYTATPTNQPYGSATTNFTGTVTGFAYSDTLSSATAGTPSFTSTTTTNSLPGSYPITGSGLSASNYIFVQAAGNATALTISPAILTYVAVPATTNYAAAIPPLSGSVTGFVNGDTQSSATTGALAFTTPATSGSPAGSYAINGTGLSAANYTFAQAPANATALTVTPDTLTYVANPATREYGAANPAFSGTVTGFVNGDNQTSATTGTLVFSTPAALDSAPGSYPINGSGLSAVSYTFVQAPANATALTVTGEPAGTDLWVGVGPNTNWSNPNSWSPADFPGSATAVVFATNQGVGASPYSGLGKGFSGITTPANFNSVVDSGFGGTISSLSFTNANTVSNWQNVLLPNTTVLNVTGSGGLVVGNGVANIDFGITADAFATIGGSLSTLNVNNTSARVWVAEGTSTAKNGDAVLDLSGLGYFNATVSQFWVASSDSLANVNFPGGVVYLAATNNITAEFSTTASETSSTAGTAAFIVGDTSSSNGTNSFLYLGQNNMITADTIFTAREKLNAATMAFNPNLPNLNSPTTPPTVTFQGYSASAVSIFSVGDGAANSGTDSGNGTDNFLGGIVNANISTLNVGRGGANAAGGGNTVGVLSFSAGTITAATCNLGVQPTANTAGKFGTGTINVGTNAALATAGTFSITSVLNIGLCATQTNALGTLNVTNGTVMANSVVCSGISSNSTINFIGGSFYLTNQLGAPNAPLFNLNLSNVTIHLNLNGTPSTVPTNMVVSNMTFKAGSTATIAIDSIVNATGNPFTGGTRTFPLINYAPGNDPIANLTLAALPANTTSTGLIDNTAANRIDLQVTYTPPPALTWSGSVNTNWDTTTLNWNSGTAAYADPDLVTFDDTASRTNVALIATVSPSAILVTNNTLNYVFTSYGGKILGLGGLTKAGTASLTLQDNGDTFTGGISANQGILILDGASSVSGGLTIASGATAQLGNNDANGTFPSGGVVDNGGLVFNRSDSPIISTAISGTGTVTNSGTGTITLSVANTFGGGLSINSGTVQVSATGSGSTPLGGVANNSSATPAGNVTVNAGATLVGLGTDSFGFHPDTAPNMIFINGGTVTDAGASNYRITTPNLTFTGGTFTSAVGNNGDVDGNYSFFGTGSAATIKTLAATSTAVISAEYVSCQEPTIFNTAAGTVTGGATPGVDLLVSSTIIPFGAQPITKTGPGVMELTGTNTFTGSISNQAGTLLIGGAGMLGSTSATTGTYAGAITNNAILTYSSTSAQTLSGILSGTGTLNENGPGALTLTNVNMFSGNTAINGGTLALSGAGSLASSSLIIGPAGTFDVSSLTATTYTMGGATFTAAGAGATIKGASGGSVSMGSLPINLSYNGSTPALTVSQGSLLLNGNVFTINGAPLAVGNYTIILGNVSGTVQSSAGGTAIGAGTAGALAINAGNLVLTISTATGTILTGGAPITYGSPVSITATVNPAPTNGESVIFYTNGIPLVTNALTSGATILSVSNLPAGTYSVTATYVGDATNAPSTSQPLSQVVNPATLTYTATPTSQAYGSTNTNFLGTVTGFVNNDSLATATAGTPAFTSTTTSASPIGKYVITGSGLSAANYTFVQAGANATALTITAAPVTIVSGITATNKLYDGTTAATLSLSNTVVLSGLAGSDATTVTLATNGYLASFANAYVATSVTVTVSGLTLTNGDYTNYTLTQPVLNASILPATLLYVATPAIQQVGSANTNFSGTVSGFVTGETVASATSGTLAFTSTTTASSPPGAYAITGSGLTASNYVFAQAAGNATALTIGLPNGTWTNNVSANWSGTTNWLNGTVANGQDATATFPGTAISASRTVTLDTSRTIGNIAFSSTNSGTNVWTIASSGGSVLTLATSTGTPTIDVPFSEPIGGSTESDTISAMLAGNQGFAKTSGGFLALSGANTFTGTISVTGSLRANALAALNNQNIIETGSVNGDSVYFNAAGAFSGNLNIINFGPPENDPSASHLGAVRLATSGINLSGTITLAGPAGITQRSATTGSAISGQITGNFPIRFGRTSTSSSAGNGILVLSNTANNWTGNTTNADGTLRMGAAGVIPNGPGLGNLIMTTPGVEFQAAIAPTVFDLAGFNENINGLSHDPSIPQDDMGLLVITNSSTTPASLTVGMAGSNGVYGGVISGAALTLVKMGKGTETLSGTNTYQGSTIISNGVLALTGNASIVESSVNIQTNATLDVSGLASPTFTLGGATFTSSGGIIKGAAGGTIVMDGLPIMLNYHAAPALIVSQGTLSLFGSEINVDGPVLPVGNYTVIQQTGGTISGPAWFAVTGTAIGLGMEGSLSINGDNLILTIVAADVTATVSGGQLNLTWPASKLGWTLQTNGIDISQPADWFPYPGSTNLTTISIPVLTNQPNVFFRLVTNN
jgi:autotransporter-associated beta strand protein